MKPNWNFQRGGGGVLQKIPPMGAVWIFSGIAHSTPANGLVHPRGVTRNGIISAPPTFFYQYVSFYQLLISTRLGN